MYGLYIMKFFDTLHWPSIFLFYSFIVLTGFVLGSADLSFKSKGLLISDHLDSEVMDKFKRDDAHLESFAAVLQTHYQGFEINDPENWFSNVNFSAYRLSVTSYNFASNCSDFDIHLLRKEAYASLWYYPELFSTHHTLPDQKKIDGSTEISETVAPNSILFLPPTIEKTQVQIIHCKRYLLFIPTPFSL